MKEYKYYLDLLHNHLLGWHNQDENCTWLMEDDMFVASYFKYLECTFYNEGALTHFFRNVMTPDYLDECSNKVTCQRIRQYRPEVVLQEGKE